ncbi:hypothetical protein Q1W73_02560 [Asticcacaulis sp. ZE23SCel15]|uniref:hypothetical protein n=1 Tax=Asticcacaulis sp. ZE23SCel15 TaxID=3059027 RepID=UPI00265FE571|nr:hypothetical protein [Asticcacaulis sp. ZE23SCel15]WKL57882.1 hypothetical protein Q1W73_02560 [Asticcacaulis sp. ZE23SCel15]
MTQIANSGPVWIWVVPLIAATIAFIGVVVTLLFQWRNFNKQLRSSHALKIAEMRQAWINNLRDAMSKFQSYGVTPNLNQSSEREFYELGTKIELLMNPSDPDFDDLQNCLYGFLNANVISEKYAANPKYVEVCQRILKREWDTLKQEIANASR